MCSGCWPSPLHTASCERLPRTSKTANPNHHFFPPFFFAAPYIVPLCQTTQVIKSLASAEKKELGSRYRRPGAGGPGGACIGQSKAQRAAGSGQLLAAGSQQRVAAKRKQPRFILHKARKKNERKQMFSGCRKKASPVLGKNLVRCGTVAIASSPLCLALLLIIHAVLHMGWRVGRGGGDRPHECCAQPPPTPAGGTCRRG